MVFGKLSVVHTKIHRAALRVLTACSACQELDKLSSKDRAGDSDSTKSPDCSTVKSWLKGSAEQSCYGVVEGGVEAVNMPSDFSEVARTFSGKEILFR